MNSRRARVGPFVAILAAATGGGACNLAVDGDVDPTEVLILGTLGVQVLVALVAVSGALLSSSPVRVRLGLGPGRLSAPLLGLLVIGTLGLSLALDGLLTLSELRERSVLATLDEELQGIRGGTLALALLGLAIAPGIAEELLCRGLLQRGLQPRLGAPKAIALAAIAFGALHLEAIHGVLAAVLGLYFGVATYLAGSVRAAILCHTVNNLASVAATAWGASESVARCSPSNDSSEILSEGRDSPGVWAKGQSRMSIVSPSAVKCSRPRSMMFGMRTGGT